MASQPRLLTPPTSLDARSRDAGRRGVAKARAALAEARTRAAAAKPAAHHATAA